MPDPLPNPHRSPPQPISRTTKLGADQFVLACNARRDADDTTFPYIEELERGNKALRDEWEWKRQRASKRTSKWVWARMVLLASVLPGLAALYGWAFSPNSRHVRVWMVAGLNPEIADPWKTTHFLTSDMTQQEIEAIVAGSFVPKPAAPPKSK